MSSFATYQERSPDDADGIKQPPNDWHSAALREMGSLYGGLTGKSKRDFGHGNARYVTFLNVLQNVSINPLAFEAVDVRPDECQNLVRQGDVLLNSTSETPDELALAAVVECHDPNLYLNSFCFGLRIAQPEAHNPRFLAYWFRGPRGRALAAALAQGSTRHNLSKRQFLEADLVIPDCHEQRAIAEALSDVDGLLGSLKALIAKKRVIKQAAMQQLLTGKTRLPGFSGEWERKRLGEITEIKMGQSPSSAFYNTKGLGLPLIQGNADIADRRTIKRTFTTQTTKLGRCGDILMSVRAPVGEVSRAAFDVCLGRGVCALRFSNDFLYHYLVYLEPSWARHSKGSTFDSVNSADIRAIEIVLPANPSEQTAIATVLSDMDAEIAVLERRRDKTRAIKQGMMQQLLTGRVRLIAPPAAARRDDAATKRKRPHSWAFNEAVVISTLAKHFGNEEFPLGRKRYTKLAYLLHRHAERQVQGYLKKAAGPYNPSTKYGGSERIALEKGYIREAKSGPYTGFLAADEIAEAEGYFEKWYGRDVIQWLGQFRYNRNDDLELLTTVDMAAEELRAEGRNVDVPGVKSVISSHPEWEAKLDRAVFSDRRIAEAIETSETLFGSGAARS